MIGKALQDAMNAQINRELFSSYLYLSMAAYFEERNLPGFAHWMRIQEGEERAHALKFYDHLVDRGGRVLLTALEAPRSEWKSPLEVFEEAAAHEAKVTGSIHALGPPTLPMCPTELNFHSARCHWAMSFAIAGASSGFAPRHRARMGSSNNEDSRELSALQTVVRYLDERCRSAASC